MITVRNFTYTYPKSKKPALQEIELRIEEGEFVLITGTSGCGKSTLCRAFNGLVPHFYGGTYKGDVIVDGKKVRDLHPYDLADTVGMVFQDPENQLVMTNVENELAFGLENLGIPREEMIERVRTSSVFFDLDGLLHRFIPELSGGEKQKVALGSVLAMRPKYLVLDEPTSQLDNENASMFLDHVKRLNDELGITVILVEHRLERCLDFAGRLIFMKEGRIAMDGDPDEVIERLKSIGFLRNDLLTPPAALNDGGKIYEISEVRFSYGAGEVLKGIHMQINRGDVAAIIGPNGTGKSTLLKLMIGLLKPSAGEIRLHGKSVGEMTTAEIALKVGYLGQNPNNYLFQETLEDELLFTLKNLGVDRAEWEERISWTLEKVGLTKYRYTFPRDLSTGEKERAALATVLVGKPEVLILDEPTRGLDYWMKDKLGEVIRKLRNSGMTIIIVTHDYRFIAESASRIFRIIDGRVEEASVDSFRSNFETGIGRCEA